VFHTLFIEKDLQNHPKVEELISRFSKSELQWLDSFENHFGKFRKPYLQKRNKLNLYIANKKGKLVKEAPDAYGLAGEPHYYYIHAQNCIYECEYCYLQGYFKSPDIVLFLNHEEILQEMKTCLDKHPEQNVWFHAGEFSDSLALASLTGEIEHYYPLFEAEPRAKLELRTKSANVSPLLKQKPLKNVFTSFSLGSPTQVEEWEHKTASLKLRLSAMKKLIDAGHQVAIHFDPIIYHESYLEEYAQLILKIDEDCGLNNIQYFSLGVVRFTKEVFKQVMDHYPDSNMLGSELITSFDAKVRYPKPLRMNILRSIESLLLQKGVEAKRIYLCME
jgi:spore photoproduct lyase